MPSRILVVLVAALLAAGCGNLGAKVPGKYHYFIDATTAKADDAAGLVGLQQTLQQMHVDLNADGTAVLKKNKTIVPGQWSMEGSHIYIRPKEGDMVEGTVQPSGDRILLDPLGDFSQPPSVKIYLVKD